MKHIQLIIICLGLLITSGIQAQLPAGKSTATIIADALAQLPAETPREYNRTMADLVSTGEKGLLDLVGRMNSPGKQSNETLDYAISGWIHFVANDDAARNIAAVALEKALNQPLDKDVKAFLIRQLSTIATNDNVDGLSPFLSDEYLSNPAAQALVAIGTEKAGNALLTALTTTSAEKIKLNMVNAIAQTGYQKAEPALLALLERNPSETMQQIVLNALAKTGSKESLKALRGAAENAGYLYRKDNATGSYISLLDRLNGTEPTLVKKEAEKLLVTAKKKNEQGVKVAAAGLLLANPSVKKEKILKEAIKEGNITYLSGILNSYPFQGDKKSSELIQRELASSKSPNVQTPLIYWLGNHGKKASIPQIIALTNASDKMVQKAATLSLAQLGGKESLIALLSLLKSDNDETVSLAREALSAYNGDISRTLASVFEVSGDAGKKAILSLISNRKIKSLYNLVYNQMSGNNAVVKSAAANTLKEVVTDKNLPDLFTLLERSDAAQTPAIQQAVNAALDYLPAEEQLRLVSERIKNSSLKHLYYTALANSKSQDAMDIITKAYDSSVGAEKEAAFDALTHWKSFHAIYPMLDIARNSKENRELEKVTNALISLIRNSGQTGAIRYLYLREAMQFAQTDKQKNEILQLIGHTGQYQAMLFAAHYMDTPALSETAALAAMTIAINDPSLAGKETTRILQKVSKTLSNPDAGYQRQSITKYLTENPTEGGFVSLFNGKNLDGWKGLVENPVKRAKMNPRELAAARVKADKEAADDWKVMDGHIVFDGKGYNNLCTEKQYGDFEMLVDWKLYPGPEPDAGIYLRGTPQVQIWDTARTNVGAEVGSGGLYNNQQNPSKPLKVADQKVGEWNTFRIKMIGERVSVWLNGELVTDNVILENFWDRKQPIFPVEQIELQAHGSKVAYRDLFIREIPRPEPLSSTEISAKPPKTGHSINAITRGYSTKPAISGSWDTVQK